MPISSPTIVDAATGRGRDFAASLGQGLEGADIVPGSTLLTRNMSVQAIIRWDLAAQAAVGSIGALYVRGKATGAAEYVSGGVELRVVNAALGVGEVRWIWQDTGGGLWRATGGQFQPPTDGSFVMLTATRRWVSSSSVILRYYLGDLMMTEVESFAGAIGGGTTGTTTIGTRYNGAAFTDFFDGVIDSLRVVDYELTPEEIAATWDRISKQQPRGYRAIRDLLPPGAPISNEPSSRIQKVLNLIGNGLGYAAAQTENFRNNSLPDRAYGAKLEQWERITEEPAKPLDSTDQRRARVVGHLKQRAGASMSGVASATKNILQVSASQLQFLAFDNTIREDWSQGIRTQLWDAQPPAQWSNVANALRVQAANAAVIRFADGYQDWYTCFAAALGSTNRGNPVPGRYDGAGCRILAKFTPTTLPPNGEVGVAFVNLAQRSALLFGLRNNAGVYQLITESFLQWTTQGLTVRAVSALQTHWLHLFAQSGSSLLPVSDTYFTAAWSTTSALTGYTSYANIQHRKEFSYMGVYARSFGVPATLGGALDVSIDDVWMRFGLGTRPMRFYVYRDPALAGAPDLNGAHYAIQRQKQAQTDATVITAKSVLCDSSSTGCDREPMGGF